MTHKWNYQPITPEQAEASQQLAQELGISPILGKLLVERGITTAADARKFFRRHRRRIPQKWGRR